MAFAPADFYKVAQELSGQAQTDGGHLRTLISRAYYSALIVARDAKPGTTTTGTSGHQAVINAYCSTNQQEQMIADCLRDLRKLREKADYQPKSNLTRSEGQSALASCKRVLSTLGALPPRVP